ncbi:GNAT family N-acetyltransferase [Streptomyces sp. NPDC052040]|uniref:GNAT family N-acetyltransferase n=1 Tax=Streptomyces sp. NPDC052040 TaxID=3365682 RepID=UPI0037D74C78
MSDDGGIRIRRAAAEDASVIARIHLTSRSVTMPYLPPQKRSHGQVTQWVGDVLLGQCRIWVAVHAEEVTGYAALDGDMLEHLYLRPDFRRRGIGTLLLGEVKRHSPDGVSLHVFQQNTGARAFYEHHGFTVVDIDDGEGNMEHLPAMTLRWTPGGVG